jgi:hypothetical protein
MFLPFASSYIYTYIYTYTYRYLRNVTNYKQASKVYIARIDCLCIYGIVIIIMYTFVRGYLIFVVFNVYYICGFHLLLNFASDIVSVFPPRRACTLEIYRLSISI